MWSLWRERLGDSGGAFSPRAAAYGPRISPSTPFRGVWGGGADPLQTLKLDILGPPGAVGENVVRALLAYGGGPPLEDASPRLAAESPQMQAAR